MAVPALRQKRTYDVVLTDDPADGGFIGACYELHAFSQGDTYAEAAGNVREAVALAAEAAGSTEDFNIRMTRRRR